MTQEKDQQDQSEAPENTRANSQEKKGFFSRVISRDKALRQKTYPYVAAGLCVWFLGFDLINRLWWGGRPGDGIADVECNGALLVMCFLIMGACVKEQHDRIRKPETALAARDENPAR